MNDRNNLVSSPAPDWSCANILTRFSPGTVWGSGERKEKDSIGLPGLDSLASVEGMKDISFTPDLILEVSNTDKFANQDGLVFAKRIASAF